MAINLISPSVGTTGALITDTYAIKGSSSDNIPSLTKKDGRPISAALELRSTESAFMATRLTQEEIDKIDNPDDGMILYNRDERRFNFHEDGIWAQSGNVFGPDSSIVGDIAVFANETGKLLADSNVNIAVAAPPSPLSQDVETFLRLSNLSEISFASAENAITIEDKIVSVVELQDLVFEPKTTYTDSTFDPLSVATTSVLFEINSKRASFLNARMSSAQIAALNAPNGLQVYDESTDLMLFRQANQWTPLGTISSGAPIGAAYILGTANPILNNSQSLGALTTGLLKNTVDSLEGILTTADVGVDYYAPGFPTYLKDTFFTTRNLYVGTHCGLDTGSANDNTGFGAYSLVLNTDGVGTVSVGNYSLFKDTGPISTVSVGFNSLLNSTSTSATVSLGANSGSLNAQYNSATLLGCGADTTSDDVENSTAIGFNSKVSTSNTISLGNGCNVVVGDTAAPYTVTVGTVGGQSAISLELNETTPTYPSDGGVLYVQRSIDSEQSLYFNGSRLSFNFTDLFGLTSFVIGSVSPFLPFAQSLGSLGPVNTSGLLKNSITTSINPLFDKGTLSQAIPVPLGSDTGDYYAPKFPISIRTTSDPSTTVISGNLFIGDPNIGFIGISLASVNNTVLGRGAFSNTAGGGIMSGNTGFGTGVLEKFNGGNYNTAVGSSSLANLGEAFGGSWDGNTAIGTNTGLLQTQYTNCTFLGYLADNNVNNLKNVTALGWKARGNTSNTVVLGFESNVIIGGSAAAYTLELNNVANGLSGDPMCVLSFVNTTTQPTDFPEGDGGLMWVHDDLLYYNGRLVSFGGIKGEPDNLFVGELCGNTTLTGTDNVGTGLNALRQLTSGKRNIAFGSDVLSEGTTIESNIGIGVGTLSSLIVGLYNVSIGDASFQSVTINTANTGVGTGVGSLFDTYEKCTFIGAGADATVNNLVNAIAIGANSRIGVSDAISLGDGCIVGIGTSEPASTLDVWNVDGYCTFGLQNTENVPGIPDAGEGGILYVSNDLLYFNGVQISNSISGEPNNLFVGTTVGNTTLTGTNNVGTGLESLQNLTSGTDNISSGYQALLSVTTGKFNIASGSSSLGSLENGSRNIALGDTAQGSLVGGNNNVSIGDFSFQSLIGNESNNTAVGVNAGQSVDGITSCSFFGYNSGATADNLTNATALGANSKAANSDTLVLGKGANVIIGDTAGQFSLSLGNVTSASIGSRTCVISWENTTEIPTVPLAGQGGRLYVSDDELFYNGEQISSQGGNVPPIDATYILKTADPALENAQSLGTLSSGMLKNTVSGSTGELFRAIPVPLGIRNAKSGDYYAPGFPLYLSVDSWTSGVGVPPYNNLFITDTLPVLSGTVGVFAGSFNTVVGQHCFYAATESSNNCVFGSNIMAFAQAAFNNCIMGQGAGTLLEGGSSNVLIGNSSGTALTGTPPAPPPPAPGGLGGTGCFNTALGTSTLLFQTISNYNTAIGYNAGSASLPSFNNCTFLGAQVNNSNTSLPRVIVSNSLSVGYNSNVWASNSINIGSSSVTGTATGSTNGPCITIGYSSTTTASNSITIGSNITNSTLNSCVLGGDLNVGIGNSSPAYGAHIGIIGGGDSSSTGFFPAVALEPSTPGTLEVSATATILYNAQGSGEENDLFCATQGQEINLTTQQPYYLVLNDNPVNSPLMPNVQSFQTISAPEGQTVPGFLYYTKTEEGAGTLSFVNATNTNLAADKTFAGANWAFVVNNNDGDYLPAGHKGQILSNLNDDPLIDKLIKVKSDGSLVTAEDGEYVTKTSFDEYKVDQDLRFGTIEGEIAGIEGEIEGLETEIAAAAGTASAALALATTANAAAGVATADISTLKSETYLIRTTSSFLDAADYTSMLDLYNSEGAGFLYISEKAGDPGDVTISLQPAGGGGGGADVNATYVLIDPDVTLPHSQSLSAAGSSGYVYFSDGLISLGDPTAGSGGAPDNATYIVATPYTGPDGTLSSAFPLDSMPAGILFNNPSSALNPLILANPGVDYYSPGHPTFIVDNAALDQSGNFYIGTNTGTSTSGITSSVDNMGIGRFVMPSLTGSTSKYNVGIGNNVLNALHTGGGNVVVGFSGLSIGDNNSNNSCLGTQNLINAANSNGNVTVGSAAGGLRDLYTDCVLIGKNADTTTYGLTNAISIGANAAAEGDNTVALGTNNNVVVGSGYAYYTLTLNNTTGPSPANSGCALGLASTSVVPTVTDFLGGALYVDSSNHLCYKNSTTTLNISSLSEVSYVVTKADSSVPNAKSLGALTTGLLKNTVALSEGTLSRAIPVAPGSTTGDYFSPGNPINIYKGVTSLYMGTGYSIRDVNNFGIGLGVLAALQLGSSDNASVGLNSMPLLTVGTFNTGFGNNTFSQMTTGSENTAVGWGAGEARATYTQCTFLGKDARGLAEGLVNSTALGYGARVTASNCLILGEGCNVGIGTTNALDKLHVVGGRIRLKGITTGYTGTDLFVAQNGVQTTNATATQIISVPIPQAPAGCVTVNFRISAIQSTGANAATGFGTGGAFFNGTTNALLTNSVTLNTTLLWLVGCTFAISGTNLVLNVTGIGGQTINWVVSYEYSAVRTTIV